MTLPTRNGLAFEVDAALRGILTLGWLEADGLSPEGLQEGFAHERDDALTRVVSRLAGRSAGDLPGVGENRRMFHRLGVDPTKTRPSSEALLRRVQQGKAFPSIVPAVDCCNLASVEHQFSLGLYDRDLVHGAVFARMGRGGEGYEGIRKGRVGLTERPLLADDIGAFGAPTSDSARTQVTGATRALLCVVYSPAERSTEDLSVMLARVTDLLTRYCGATVHLVHTLQ